MVIAELCVIVDLLSGVFGWLIRYVDEGARVHWFGGGGYGSSCMGVG